MTYNTFKATPGATGSDVAVDVVGGTTYQRVKPAFGVENAAVDVSATNPLPVTNPVVGAVADAPWASGDGTLVALLKTLATQALSTTDIETNDGAAQAILTAILALLPAALGAGGGMKNDGSVAHDAVDAGQPVKFGGFAKAAAPTDVSADADRVNAWFIRNGALATVLTAAGALIGGDATNGLDVDVTRLSALVAGEAHIGEVGGKTVVKTLAMSTDTSAYASGDLIADTQQLDAAFRKTDGTGVLNTLTIIDQDAQGVALYVMFHSTTTTMGTENSAPNISDANLAAGLQGMVAVTTADYITVSGAKVACIRNIGLPLKAVSGTDDLYVSILNATGAPTFTATGLNLALGILQD